MMKRRLRQIVGLAVSLVLLYILFFDPNPGAWFRGEAGFINAFFGKTRLHVEDLKEAGEMLKLAPAIIAIFILILALFIRAVRWRLIIRSVGKTSFRDVFWCNNIGFLMNNLLPFRAGEFIRAVILAQRSGLPAGSLVATVALERLLDLVGLGVMFGVALTLYPFPTWLRTGGGIFSAILAVLLLMALLFSRSGEKAELKIRTLGEKHGGLIQRFAGTTINVLRGFRTLRHGGTMFHVFWQTMLLWFMYSLTMTFVLHAFSFTDGRYPLLAGDGVLDGVVITIVTALGMGLPSAPGAVGTYHGAVVLVLAWFNVPEALAVVFATSVHAMNYIILSLVGLLGIWRMGFSWSSIVHQNSANAEKMEKSE